MAPSICRSSRGGRPPRGCGLRSGSKGCARSQTSSLNSHGFVRAICLRSWFPVLAPLLYSRILPMFPNKPLAHDGGDQRAHADDVEHGHLIEAGLAQPEQILFEAAWLVSALRHRVHMLRERAAFPLLAIEGGPERFPHAAVRPKERRGGQPNAVQQQEEAARREHRMHGGKRPLF